MNDLINYLSAPSIRSFLVFWLTVPIVLIILYEGLVRLGKTQALPNTKYVTEDRHTHSNASISRLSLVSLVLFIAFLGFYIFLMFYKEDFAFFDNVVFIDFSLIGKPYWMPMWRDSGRFWPLGLQEYNFLSLLGKNQFIYISFSVFQLFIVLLVVNKLLAKLPLWGRLVTMTLIMITPSFVISFFGLIYPERNVIFWLSIVLACSYAWLKSETFGSRYYLYGALVAAQFCLYYKEPVCVLIGTFAGTKLLIDLLENWQELKNSPGSFLKRNYIDIGLLILSFLFIIYYWIDVVPHIVSRYQWNAEETPFLTFISYIKTNFLLSTFLITFLLRCIYLIAVKKLPHKFWDSLALAAVLYFLAYVRLTMYTDYYLAPVDFVSALYLSQLAYRLFRAESTRASKKFVLLSAITALGILIVNQSLQHSSYSILTRKAFITGQVELADTIEQYANESKNPEITLFFPEPTEPYFIGVFAAFLEYRGFNLFQEDPGQAQNSEAATSDRKQIEGTTLTLKAPIDFQDNLCVPFAFFQCFRADKPETGDLIVILPGWAEPEKIKALETNSSNLLTYQQKNNFSKVERILLIFAQPQQETGLLKTLLKHYGDQYSLFDMDVNLSFMDAYLFRKS